MDIWDQREIRLPAKPRGFHLVTEAIVDALPSLREVEFGLLHVFIQHTSASLTINENADPDVRRDFEKFTSHLVPERFPYAHDAEGPDDMPAHLKGSIFGSSVSIPIRHGELALGTWQGIYLGEHRDQGGSRRLIATVHGSKLRG